MAQTQNGTAVPVFIVGAARSGTTLVYSLLLSSGVFPLYEAETHLLESCPRYGSLDDEANFARLMADWLGSKQFARSRLDAEQFRAVARRHRGSCAELLGCFMACIAERQGKQRWVEKTPAHVFHLATLARAFPDARFVHVIRDGRDVALSKRKMGWIEGRDPLRQLLHGALQWQAAVRAGRAAGRRLGERYLELRYEDLTEQPEAAIAQLAHFIEAPLSLEAVRDSSVVALGRGNTAFGENMRGVSRQATQRWRRGLSAEEVWALERVVGPTLTALGYELGSVQPQSPVAPGWRWRLYGEFYGARLALRRLLKHHTPLGRLSTPRWEQSAG
ncbi:MAG TPA: sulfotransferase [Candidatus Competibacteraceae bacterium]|nr:sulfotransferase [Candidatus Competibacteraceae bacterium]